MPPPLTPRQFFRLCDKVHGGMYDYSKTEYRGLDLKIRVLCPEHGYFTQTAKLHRHGHHCPQCGVGVMRRTKRMFGIRNFLKRAAERHGSRFDYSRVAYRGKGKPVLIGCPVHGEFQCLPGYHLKSDYGCPRCGRQSQRDQIKDRWDGENEGLKSKYVGRVFGTVQILKFVGGCGGKRRWRCCCTVCGAKSTRSTGILREGSCSECLGMKRGRLGFWMLYRRYRDGKRVFDLTPKQFKSITSQNCHYCGQPPSQVSSKRLHSRKHHWGDYIYNGIDRKDNDVGYVLSNCLPCCKECNWSKSNRSYAEFTMWLDRIATFRACPARRAHR